MDKASARTVALGNGDEVAALGQGTWYMGEKASVREQEVAALREGVELGMTLIDTAEMYGSGASEEMIGEAIADRRDDVYLVSKVLPSNAAYDDAIAACGASLERLGTDRLDLYLLHWRGGVELQETIDAFRVLQERGRIGAWGVSNFDADDMEELLAADGGEACAVNQVLYNLTRRWPEPELLPLCRERGVPVMAYSPIEQGRMLRHPELTRIAADMEATPAQVALAWLLRDDDVVVIPKASRPEHVRENFAAYDVGLGESELAALDAAFPAPTGRPAMEIL